MRKADAVLLAAILLAALLVFLALRVTTREGAVVVIYTNGEETARFPLSESREIPLTGYRGGSNILVIGDGVAFMKDADCPDLTCVHEGKISKNGQSIICLPHRITVTVEGGEAADVDAVAE